MILVENGMDDPGNVTLAKGLHDTTRINYYEAYITQLKRAIDDGANVEGYFAWSLLDNFEWRLGYTSRFGIVFVDTRPSRTNLRCLLTGSSNYLAKTSIRKYLKILSLLMKMILISLLAAIMLNSCEFLVLFHDMFVLGMFCCWEVA